MKNNRQRNQHKNIERRRRSVGTIRPIGGEEESAYTFEWGYVDDHSEELARPFGRFHNLQTPQTVRISTNILQQLTGLNDLKLHYCTFTELPSAIRRLKKLERLEIHFCNSLAYLPESIACLESLTVLTISNCNDMARLPMSIGRLKRLKTLMIYCCPSLFVLPSSIGELNSLEQLQIISTSLRFLPNKICKLKKLRELWLCNCELLTVLPDSIGKLRNLRRLTIEGCNQVASIPKSIGELKNLFHMRLGCSRIASLPMNLEILEITNSQILTSPVELSNLSNLKTLSIAGSDSSIFDSIVNISNLTCLSLRVPADIVNSLPFLPRLESLGIHIARNSRSDGVPDAFGIKIFDRGVWREGSALKDLYIGGDYIQWNYDSILRGGLLPKNLQKLTLENCTFRRVFDDICLPRGLIKLTLRNCSRSSYSESERVDCIRSLVTKYERLGNIIIHDEINGTGPCGVFLPNFPMKEAFLMKFNQCGRMLVQHNEGTKVKPLPISLWPALLERVHSVVERRELTWKQRHDHDKEIEASIVFQLLQGPAFLSRGFVDDSRKNNIVPSLRRKQKEIRRSKGDSSCLVM